LADFKVSEVIFFLCCTDRSCQACQDFMGGLLQVGTYVYVSWRNYKSSIQWSSGHGSRAIQGMYCLRSFGSRDRGFESDPGYRCLVFAYMRFSVFVYR
jgi:hypothetical protein